MLFPEGTNLKLLNIRRPPSLGFALTLAAAKPRLRSREFSKALGARVCVPKSEPLPTYFPSFAHAAIMRLSARLAKRNHEVTLVLT
jgi:hypothetical protein